MTVLCLNLLQIAGYVRQTKTCSIVVDCSPWCALANLVAAASLRLRWQWLFWLKVCHCHITGKREFFSIFNIFFLHWGTRLPHWLIWMFPEIWTFHPSLHTSTTWLFRFSRTLRLVGRSRVILMSCTWLPKNIVVCDSPAQSGLPFSWPMCLFSCDSPGPALIRECLTGDCTLGTAVHMCKDDDCKYKMFAKPLRHDDEARLYD